MSGRERLDYVDPIRHVLRNAGFAGDWNVTPAAHGSTRRAFVAWQGYEALFVKRGPVHPALDRLSDLGVTPPILAHRRHDGDEFTVYPYIHGVVADPAWLRDHAHVMVDMLNLVQRDEVLTGLLGSAAPVATVEGHRAAVVTRLIERAKEATAPVFRSPEIGAALERLRDTRYRIGEPPLVPAHTDPNPSNVLVASGRTYLVDWDGIMLSDPMRDIGLLLWWFLPPERWPALLRRFWLPDADSAASIDRAYWWSAVTSLRVALWIDQHTPDDGGIMSFLEDFHEAEARRPNPKRTAS